MILACPQCAARLQLDDARVPARPFTVRCPKCQQTVGVQPPALADSASLSSDGDLPAAAPSRVESRTASASVPGFKLDPPADRAAEVGDSLAEDKADLVRLLARLFREGAAAATMEANGKAGGHRPAWERRTVLICADEAQQGPVAQVLMKANYEVFIAADTREAIERMRAGRIDIVILEPEFDQIEKGAAFITREINSLRPAERRRLFFVQLSSTARTADQHAAFINHVNFILNPADVEDLPHKLENAIRDHDELYRDFNKAIQVAGL